MKKINIILSAIFLVMNFCFISCETTNVVIPGKKSMQIENIYTEYFNIAEIYFSLEKYDKAAQYYETSLNGKKNSTKAYYKLGRCKAYLGKWSEAEEIYANLLNLDPENTSLKSAVAYIYAQQGKTNEAINLYKQLLEVEPDNVINIENLLSVYLLEKDLENSEKLISKLETDFPENTKLSKFKEEYEKNNQELNPDCFNDTITDSQ